MTDYLSYSATHQVAKKQRRATQLFATAFAFMALMALMLPTKLTAQIKVPFKQRTSIYSPDKPIYHLQGDFEMLGNSNLTISPYSDNANNQDNGITMKYVDVDDDDNTINSSMANLKFSNEHGANPECTQVVYAGLYWTGRKLGSNQGAGVNNDPMEITIGGTQSNATNSNTYNGYRLTITKTGSTSTDNMSSSVVTYRFHPTNVSGTGSDVV